MLPDVIKRKDWTEWLPRVLTMRVRIPLIAEKENGLSGRIIATVELPGEVFMKLVIVSIPFHFTSPRGRVESISKVWMVPLSLSLSLSRPEQLEFEGRSKAKDFCCKAVSGPQTTHLRFLLLIFKKVVTYPWPWDRNISWPEVRLCPLKKETQQEQSSEVSWQPNWKSHLH